MKQLIGRFGSIGELWRFYQAAVINTAFGFGTFALLVWMGLNVFLAQILAHVLGVAFNYLTYSRHVFRDAEGGRVRFLAAYGVNYLVNLAFLSVLHQFIASPYIAGGLSAFGASLLNYLALRHFVFVKAPA